MTITSKVELCNMALSHLGNYDSVASIDTPDTNVETHFARWYDVTRRATLRLLIPNFAMKRRLVAQKSTAPAFGYKFAHAYPSDCLRILAFGDIDAKDVRYNVEADSNGDREIQLDTDYSTSGMPLRFIYDVTDVSKFDDDFKIMFSWALAANVVLPITQDTTKQMNIQKMLPAKLLEVSGTSAQENPPVRKSTSKAKSARYSDTVRNNEKK